MSQQYGSLVKAVSLAAVIFATIMLVIKIYAWAATGSVSLLAALVDSLVDITASSVNFVIIRFSLRPADDNHSFGHGKAESLAALAQSMFVAGSAIFLFLMGIERLTNTVPMQNVSMGLLITLISFFSTGALVLFQRYVVKRTQSQAIWADMLHYQTDVMINGAILVALVMTAYGFKRIDAIFALGIAVYILFNAIKMAHEAVQSLLDHTLSVEEQQKIIELAVSETQVLDVHDLRTRRSGNTRFIQLHLGLQKDLSLFDAHQIAVVVEQKLLKEYPYSDVIIHMDPFE